MDSKQVLELTSRVVSGEQLTPDQERRLLQWMSSRPKARDDLLANEELDSALRCLDRLAATEDEFVNSTLQLVSESARQPDVSSSVLAPAAKPTGQFAKSPGRRPFRENRLEKIFALCATLLLMGSLAWLVWSGLQMIGSSSPSPQLAEENGEGEILRPELGFAYVVSMDGAVWDREHTTGDRLDRGVLKLVQGESLIRFDTGTEVQLLAPAVLDLRSPDEVILTRGELTVSVPRQAVGFTVATPVGRVVDLGTVFDVSVESSGKTETRVRRGKVVFSPQSQGGIPGKPIELTAAGLDRAISSVPPISAPTLPVSTIVSGKQGRFMGVISAGGQTLEFGSMEAFQEYQTQVFKQLRESPSEFERNWSTMVKSRVQGQANASTGATSFAFGGSGGAQSRSISVTENGKTVSISESTATGISVTITEIVGGKQRRKVVEAKSVEELQEKNAEAFRLYDRHFGASKD